MNFPENEDLCQLVPFLTDRLNYKLSFLWLGLSGFKNNSSLLLRYLSVTGESSFLLYHTPYICCFYVSLMSYEASFRTGQFIAVKSQQTKGG